MERIVRHMSKLNRQVGIIMGNGRIVNFMERGNSFFKMGHIIWGRLSKVLLMVKGGIVIIMAAYMKARSRTIKPTDLEFIMTLSKDMNIMVSGKMMFHMEKESKSSKTVHIMKANSFME